MADPVSYGNPDRDIEQALIALKKGTQLIKYSRKGKPKFCPFRLSPDETTLIWYSHGSERNLKLSAVQSILPGQRTPVFRRFLRPEKEYLSFSLIYNNGDRSLDLICKDKAKAEIWIAGLKTLTSTGNARGRRTRSDIPDVNVSPENHRSRSNQAAIPSCKPKTTKLPLTRNYNDSLIFYLYIFSSSFSVSKGKKRVLYRISKKTNGVAAIKNELLYQQVNYGNSERIKSLRSEGAGLEWLDKEGKTPLILACMNPELYNVAKTLIELGANVIAYRPGRHARTPLHHASKRGLHQTVKLILSHGANALVMNDDCQTPLDVTRIKGFSNVVRSIESHTCLFSGWMIELYGPGFLEPLAPQLLSRKVWVAVIPCGSRSLKKPFKLELAVYANPQDAQPRTIVTLWKANMEEPNFSLPDPTVTITDSSSRTHIKLLKSDKQQLRWFYDACKGIPQVVHPAFPFNPPPQVVPATAPPTSEDVGLAMAIDASLQSAVQGRPPHVDGHPVAQLDASTSRTSSDSSGPSSPKKGNSSGYKVPETSPDELVVQQSQSLSISPVIEPTLENSASASIPSAPPLSDAVVDDRPIHYPTIDNSPLDFAPPPVKTKDARPVGKNDAGGSSSSCVICLDAPTEGACIPCGHMAGCMSCLNEIKAKKWGCPVCRSKIDQVVRLYAV